MTDPKTLELARAVVQHEMLGNYSREVAIAQALIEAEAENARLRSEYRSLAEDRDGLISDGVVVAKQRDALRAENEKLNVQLAGCLTAAEGWARGENRAKEGDYGWSLAFEKVCELRAENEKLRAGYLADENGNEYVAVCILKEKIRELEAENEKLKAPIPDNAVYRSMSEGKRLVVQLKAYIEKLKAQVEDYEAALRKIEEFTGPSKMSETVGTMAVRTEYIAHLVRSALSRYSRSEGVKR